MGHREIIDAVQLFNVFFITKQYFPQDDQWI